MNLSYLAIGISILAIAIATLTIWIVGRTTNNALKLRLDEQEAYLDRLAQWYKKLNMNYARLKGSEASGSGSNTGSDVPANADGEFAMLPNETPEQWKSRMRMKIATQGLRR